MPTKEEIRNIVRKALQTKAPDLILVTTKDRLSNLTEVLPDRFIRKIGWTTPFARTQNSKTGQTTLSDWKGGTLYAHYVPPKIIDNVLDSYGHKIETVITSCWISQDEIEFQRSKHSNKIIRIPN